MEKTAKLFQCLFDNIGNVIHGKEEQIKQIFATWLIGGHVLLEDVPGTGKTILAKTIAKLINIDFGRVQFTPDLLPSDVVGTTIYDQTTHKFKYRKGPIFSTFFLADEINRATSRTQSALLECMAEKQVTIEGHTEKLNPLFIVMATQNPIEQHGTFPLPEAQLDRFCIKISLGYPTPELEIHMAKIRNSSDPFDKIEPIISENDILKIKKLVPKIKVSDNIYAYVQKIIQKTRNHNDLTLGAGPRATISLIKLAQAYALIENSDYVKPSYIYDLAIPTLSHRICLTPEAAYAENTQVDVIKDIIHNIKTPQS